MKSIPNRKEKENERRKNTGNEVSGVGRIERKANRQAQGDQIFLGSSVERASSGGDGRTGEAFGKRHKKHFDTD